MTKQKQKRKYTSEEVKAILREFDEWKERKTAWQGEKTSAEDWINANGQRYELATTEDDTGTRHGIGNDPDD